MRRCEEGFFWFVLSGLRSDRCCVREARQGKRGSMCARVQRQLQGESDLQGRWWWRIAGSGLQLGLNEVWCGGGGLRI